MSSSEKHHHKKKEDRDKSDTGGEHGGARGYSETVTADLSRYEVFARQQKHLGETGGDFDDLYDEGEAKKDPEHEHRHKITEDVAATAAAGAGGYAFHEHHEDAEEASGEKKHRHLFG